MTRLVGIEAFHDVIPVSFPAVSVYNVSSLCTALLLLVGPRNICITSVCASGVSLCNS